MSKIYMKEQIGFTTRSLSVMEKVSAFIRENDLKKIDGSYFTKDDKFYGNLRKLISEVE